MNKYFKEKQEQEKLLSEYLTKDCEYFKENTLSESSRIIRTEYLISILGDVPFNKDIYDLFIRQFQCFGGRYNVRTRPDTIQDIYQITRMYPILTKTAIEEIWFRYIKDFFKEYELITVLNKYIEKFDKTDESFELFIDEVEKKAEQHQQRYIEDSLHADELKEDYGENFTKHVKGLIIREHYTYDEITKYLPSAEIVKKDEQHINDISTKSRILFGCCEPVSYTMFDILIEEKTLDKYTETPTYYISTERQEQATFTKTQFLESIKKTQKVLKRKGE